jgi:hypothetical protein
MVLVHYQTKIRRMDRIHGVCVLAVCADVVCTEAFRSGLYSLWLGTLLWIESLPWLGLVLWLRIPLWIEIVLLCDILPCLGLHPFLGILLVL